ncbi:hypothetical protein PPACK8108_LOCUS3945, partial [Phakopsora pachyrhizi]
GLSFSAIELGAGSLKKTSYLLRNIAASLKSPVRGSSEHYLARAEYYALDLEYRQLVSTLSELQKKNKGVGPMIGSQVQVRGICGTYDQGLEWLARSVDSDAKYSDQNHRRAILWLGSSIGNLSPLEALDFLKNKLKPLLNSESKLLIGIDNCKVPAKVEKAYNDSQGVTRKFILNAVRVVGRHLGLEEGTLRPDQFDYVSRFNVGMSRHEAFLRARQNLVISVPSPHKFHTKLTNTVIKIEEGELILVEKSHKFSENEVYRLLDESGMRVIQKWSNFSTNSPSKFSGLPVHTLYLVEKAPFTFSQDMVLFNDRRQPKSVSVIPLNAKLNSLLLNGRSCNGTLLKLKSSIHRNSLLLFFFFKKKNLLYFENPPLSKKGIIRHNVPSWQDWLSLWSAWDTVTLGMIPKDKLLCKPIDLRHICLFYLGHIPVFADIHLSKQLGIPHLEPKSFYEVFERGIDPIINDPNKCHSHSKVPDKECDWPSLGEILKFRDNLRQRILDVYQSFEELASSNFEAGNFSMHLGRVLCMIYEHEAMHIETLLYMLVQAPWVRYPPGFTPPDWNSLSIQWDLQVYQERRNGGSNELMEFPTKRTLKLGHNDSETNDLDGSEAVLLKSFGLHEFGWDNENPERVVEVGPFKIDLIPISNEKYLEYLIKNHSVTLPLPQGKIPKSWSYEYTKPSSLVDSFWFSHQIKIKTVYGLVDFKFAKHWPVQASGRQIEAFAKSRGGRLPTSAELRLFREETTDPDGNSWRCSGLKDWHPVPPRKPIKENNEWFSFGNSGGVWEWTQTQFEPHEGFVASSNYPGYSEDFFDGLHYEIVGGSWATIPRIANRKSMVNWYQFEYPYVFCGGRVAYDY